MNSNCNCPACRSTSCSSTIRKPIDISTPVRVEPNVRAGRIRTQCERPRICPPSDGGFDCARDRACDFVIKQTINVEIPMHYDVKTDIGESHIDCK